MFLFNLNKKDIYFGLMKRESQVQVKPLKGDEEKDGPKLLVSWEAYRIVVSTAYHKNGWHITRQRMSHQHAMNLTAIEGFLV
jgi:hypothetical protein